MNLFSRCLSVICVMNINDSQFGTHCYSQTFCMKVIWVIWYGNIITTQCFPICKRALSRLVKKAIQTPVQKILHHYWANIFVASLLSMLDDLSTLRTSVGLKIGAWATLSVFGLAGRFCTAEYAETEALRTHCTANQMMTSHWKPLAGFLLCPLAQCPFAPTPCRANTASTPWTHRSPPYINNSSLSSTDGKVCLISCRHEGG